jgi:hypothetical protein
MSLRDATQLGGRDGIAAAKLAYVETALLHSEPMTVWIGKRGSNGNRRRRTTSRL